MLPLDNRGFDALDDELHGGALFQVSDPRLNGSHFAFMRMLVVVQGFNIIPNPPHIPLQVCYGMQNRGKVD